MIRFRLFSFCAIEFIISALFIMFVCLALLASQSDPLLSSLVKRTDRPAAGHRLSPVALDGRWLPPGPRRSVCRRPGREAAVPPRTPCAAGLV
jgi:hypothetical protein